MPTFLESIFGRKKLTSTGVKAELEKFKSELSAAPGRIKRAKAALDRVVDMTDAEHEEAIAELAAAERSEVRLKAQVDQLRAAAERAKKAEVSSALRARADANDKALRTDYMRLVADYEAKAKALVEVVEAIRRIDDETTAINAAIRDARRVDPNGDYPGGVLGSTDRFRSEPDVVEPDRKITYDQNFFEGKPTTAVFEERGGKLVSTHAGIETRRMTRIEPGKRKKGRSLPAPTAQLFIPAARLGADAFWPRAR